MFVSKKIFLTKGVGRHREKLNSFEMALRDAGIAHFNIVRVSSIFPPGCKIISKKEGLKYLRAGEVVFCVMSQAETNEPHRLAAHQEDPAPPAGGGRQAGLAVGPEEDHVFVARREHGQTGDPPEVGDVPLGRPGLTESQRPGAVPLEVLAHLEAVGRGGERPAPEIDRSRPGGDAASPEHPRGAPGQLGGRERGRGYDR